MSKITRRGLLGGSAALLGAAAACGRPAVAPEATADAGPDMRPAYAGTAAFQHGVASGDPLADSVILWTRVTPLTGGPGAIPVTWEMFSDAGLTQRVARGHVAAEPSRDWCVKLIADGLTASTEYFYRFTAKTEAGEIISGAGRTRTTAAGGDAPVKLAVISCSNFPFGFFNVYRELGRETGLDAIVHLGDYIYEYGIDGYGGSVGAQIGRMHEPVTEIVTLEDYRMRHAQYKADPDLQAAHAAAPWLCTWDDHESTNNSYRSGAENHNQEENEGTWGDRKQAAVRAYLEWMPVRDPEPGRLREAIYRKFEFGDVATIFCLESRLLGRSDEISWFTELGGKPAAEVPMAAARTMVKVSDPARTMLGDVQETWLSDGLHQSVREGKAWQVLANQVVMAKVKPPAFQRTLTQAQIDMQQGYGRMLVDFSALGLPWNLDAWDGFPLARERLYAAAQSAKARLVTLTGDTHTSWANELHDEAGTRLGVEFGCTSVSSPGFGTYMPGVPDLGEQFAAANPDVIWYRPEGHGFTRVTLQKDSVQAEFVEVSDILTQDYEVSTIRRFAAQHEGAGVSGLIEV